MIPLELFSKLEKMIEEEVEIAIKIVVVGNGGVGKSSMIQRYCKGCFTKDYKKTIGVDFLEKQIEIDNEPMKLMLWDTAGQEEFDAITKAYYRGAEACVLAFSTTDPDAFAAVSAWKTKVENEVDNICMALIMNKIDLDDHLITRAQAERKAEQLDLPLYLTSVKDDINVNEVFEYLARSCLKKHRQVLLPLTTEITPRVGVSLFTTEFPPAENGNSKNGQPGRQEPVGSPVISLVPSKRRTGGKKSLVDRAAKCRLL